MSLFVSVETALADVQADRLINVAALRRWRITPLPSVSVYFMKSSSRLEPSPFCKWSPRASRFSQARFKKTFGRFWSTASVAN